MWGKQIAESREDGCGFIKSEAPRVNKWLADIRVRDPHSELLSGLCYWLQHYIVLGSREREWQ